MKQSGTYIRTRRYLSFSEMHSFEEEHPRLLKVVFASRQHQREVLSLFPKMAKEKKDDFPFSNVYVRRSMTFEERQADKLLRDEVKRRQENHEKCWVYAGRIVTERVQKPTQSKPQGNRY